MELVAELQSGLMKGNRLDKIWNLPGHYRRRNRNYRARLAAAFGEAVGDLLSLFYLFKNFSYPGSGR